MVTQATTTGRELLMYPDTELMDAYDRWCETEYDTEGDYCTDCGTAESLNDCDGFLVCDDCGADRYEMLNEPS